jgi:Rps23 Pro-64 3,4-dihydroxylase Tpa1-like proline 4-hydroxylase
MSDHRSCGIKVQFTSSRAQYNDIFTVLEFISAAVRERAEALRGEFQSATPFRHVVMDDFLTPVFCGQLMAEFPPFDPKKARNEFGEVGGKAVFMNLPQLGPAYSVLDKMLRNRKFLSFMGRITGIPDLLYDRNYVGGGTHENLDGQDLDPHVDFNYHPDTYLYRRLNLIIFLNPEWRKEWGGVLELHVNPWLPAEKNPLKTIVPVANRAVVFETSEVSWHGFNRISLPPEKRHLSRRSIAVYYYTKRRPADAAGLPHSTIYVPRPLPAHIQAGYTLSEEDVDALRTLVVRRNMQIRFLYGRDKEFSTAVQVIMRSRAYRFYMMMIHPLRSWLKTWHLH